MTWTVTNLLIEIGAGIVGAHVAAVAASDYSFGRLGHSVVGAIGGGFSGYFLQLSIALTANTNGVFHGPRPFEQVVAHGLAGATAGGIAMLIVGFLLVTKIGYPRTVALNMGRIDRALRVIAGVAVLSLIFVGPQSWWGLLGLVPLGTALIGWCPPYAMMGINTCRVPPPKKA